MGEVAKSQDRLIANLGEEIERITGRDTYTRPEDHSRAGAIRRLAAELLGALRQARVPAESEEAQRLRYVGAIGNVNRFYQLRVKSFSRDSGWVTITQAQLDAILRSI